MDKNQGSQDRTSYRKSGEPAGTLGSNSKGKSLLDKIDRYAGIDSDPEMTPHQGDAKIQIGSMRKNPGGRFGSAGSFSKQTSGSLPSGVRYGKEESSQSKQGP